MIIFKNKAFHRWAKKIKLTDKALIIAVDEMKTGKVDANLGGYIYKKRVALGNRGKRSGARTIIAFQYSGKAFFIFGFDKKQVANISDSELTALRRLAKILFSYNDEELATAIGNGELIEVKL